MLTKSSVISCWMLQVVFSTQKTARIPGHLHSRHSDDLLFGQCCRRISKLARNAGGSCPTGNIVQCPAMIMTRQDTGPWSGSFVHGFTGAVSEGTCALWRHSPGSSASGDIVRLQTKTPNAKLAFIIVNYWQNRDGRNCRRWFSVTRPHHHVPP